MQEKKSNRAKLTLLHAGLIILDEEDNLLEDFSTLTSGAERILRGTALRCSLKITIHSGHCVQVHNLSKEQCENAHQLILSTIISWPSTKSYFTLGNKCS